MPNEKTGVDRVLDWIVPIRLSGKWMNVEVERGVKIMLSLILLATIPTHAISKTLEVVPPDVVDRLAWTKFSLYLLCDIIVYVEIVAGFLLLKPFVLELVEVIKEFIKKKMETNDEESLIQEIVPMVKVDPIEVPLPIHSKPQPSEPESELRDLPSITANTYFSKNINEPVLKAFIKTNPNRFSSGEDIAIFYLLMTEKSYIGTSKKEFHNFIFGLINCVGYTQLSNACAKVKAILHYKWHDANEEMVNKYQDLWEDLQIFILN